MRNALLLSLLITAGTNTLFAQAQAPAPAPGRSGQAAPAPAPATPAAPAPAPGRTGQTPAPAPPKTGAPAGRAAQPAAAARSGLALVVTDPTGATLPDIQVDVTGPTPRNGQTNPGGQVNFTLLQAGTYRLLFSGPTVISFEREVTVRAGRTEQFDIMLKAAPPPKVVIKEVPAATPPTVAAPVGPSGQLQVTSLVDLAEKEYERKQARRESLVSCSGNLRGTLLQLNQDQPERLYQDADSLFYVVAGEGFIRIDSKETSLKAGGFASVPRATSFTLGRRGRNPFILLSVLSGEPCEEAR